MVAGRRMSIALAGGFVAETVNRIFPIIIIHYVATRIGVERFGYAQMGIQIIDLAVFFIMFGFPTLAAVDIGRARGDKRAISRVISEITVLKLLNAFIAIVVLWVLTTYLSNYEPYRYIVMSLSFMLFSTALDMAYVHLGTQRMPSLSFLTVASKSLSLVLIVLLVHDPDDAVLYAVLSFGANALVSLGNITLTLKQYNLVWPGTAPLKKRFVTACPYAATVLLFIVFDRFDLFIVESQGGVKLAGLYAGPARLVLSLINIMLAMGSIFLSEMVTAKTRQSLTGHIA